jgi:hypothetical protein
MAEEAVAPLDQDAAEALLKLMADISEEHYAAGWMQGLEDCLWWIAHGGDPRYGTHDVASERIVALRELSERAGGWWFWDSTGERDETFIGLDAWTRRFESKAPAEWVEQIRRSRA